jgi:hypothetical protein
MVLFDRLDTVDEFSSSRGNAARIGGIGLQTFRDFPLIVVYLASPFCEFMRELVEMSYRWQVPLRLDNC